MKTLVIHPEDPSTDFLTHIYYNLDCDVINDANVTSYDIDLELENYDRVICLGHGCADGLFGLSGLIIDSFQVDVLKDKELVCIWCNADKFMIKHKLSGFYSGMFISEMGEARAYDVDCTFQGIEDSNNMFSILLGENIDNDDRLNTLKDLYKLSDNPVTDFNRNRLYETKGV